jgi:hypothetical protein
LVLVLAAIFAAFSGIALAAVSTAANNSPGVDAVGCTLVVPANPLTARGLATPYRLVGPCHEADPATSAFVQATIVDPTTGQISVYDPLVVDQGVSPAIRPVAPTLPTGAVVGVWFGFNGDNLTLRATGDGLTSAGCVNGLAKSIFGQFAYCNAPNFFMAANTAIAAGKLTIPDLGTAKDGQPCMSTRDFGLVDMDQSDNVTTTYLFLPNGATAQNTAANRAALVPRGARIEVNGSDNGLLDAFVAPALGCTPYSAPDLADPGKSVTSLALNELQAAAHQKQPVALVPTSDPMALVNGRTSVAKTNLYRAGVDQPQINTTTETPRAYCQNLVTIGVPRTRLDRSLTSQVTSPDAAAANSLFTFLAKRLNGSFTELGCGRLLRLKNPVTVVTNKNGVAIDARFGQPSSPSAVSSNASATATNSSGTITTAPGKAVTPSPSTSDTSTAAAT